MKCNIFILALLFLQVFISCEDANPKDENELNLKSKEAVIESNNNFAFDFFERIYENETKEINYMVSPVSLSLALGMAYNGSDTDTKTAFEEVLNYQGLSMEQINLINQNLIDNLTSTSEGSMFEVANSLWSHKTFPIKQSFVDLNTTYYNAEARTLDFGDNASVDIINNWVSEKTHEKIPTIINEISPDIVLFLINAIYFNGTWKYQFDPDHSKTGMFYPEDGDGVELEMMAMEETLDYLKTDYFTSVILPYENEKYQMALLRPKNDKTLNDVVTNLNADNWNIWKSAYKPREMVEVNLPKFKTEYEKTLNEILSDMGLGIAFTTNADFSGISDIQLLISYVKQKTFIDVNEEGTEAAAVTIIGFETTSAEPGTIHKTIFKLDKPFVYLITEKETGAICFIGKVGLPKYEE